MKIIVALNEWQEIRASLKNKRVGFVPTMGNLHQGHMSLCASSQMNNDVTAVSIFVNPTQFNQTQDFEHYPRTLEADITKLSSHNIDYLLVPSSTEIYNDNYEIQLTENNISLELEGQFRPNHFAGMLTVVLKLLHLVQPSNAYFGEKDFQQLLLIKKMVASLFIPTQIIACPTIRAEDGLALSSRNSKLTAVQRKKAASLYQSLNSTNSTDIIIKQLTQLGFKVDYIVEKWQRRLGAVWLDNVRLIDNVELW
ncbi:MAG: pantoate--beta-alanine ligase [Gammaproteobacteria bacterium]|nr:pantoate--beta-alanine ligase [Gammaproteobacteria bacterium]